MPPFFINVEDAATGSVIAFALELPSVDHVLAEMTRIELEVARATEGAREVSVTARDCVGRTVTRREVPSGVLRRT